MQGDKEVARRFVEHYELVKARLELGVAPECEPALLHWLDRYTKLLHEARERFPELFDWGAS